MQVRVEKCCHAVKVHVKKCSCHTKVRVKKCIFASGQSL